MAQLAQWHGPLAAPWMLWGCAPWRRKSGTCPALMWAKCCRALALPIAVAAVAEQATHGLVGKGGSSKGDVKAMHVARKVTPWLGNGWHQAVAQANCRKMCAVFRAFQFCGIIPILEIILFSRNAAEWHNGGRRPKRAPLILQVTPQFLRHLVYCPLTIRTCDWTCITSCFFYLSSPLDLSAS